MGFINLFLIVAVLAITLALYAHLSERQFAMALTQDELVASLNNATALLAETRATVDKVATEQLGLLVKIDELTAALAGAGTTLSPEAETALAALNAEAAALKGDVDSVDAQVADTPAPDAPV